MRVVILPSRKNGIRGTSVDDGIQAIVGIVKMKDTPRPDLFSI